MCINPLIFSGVHTAERQKKINNVNVTHRMSDNCFRANTLQPTNNLIDLKSTLWVER